MPNYIYSILRVFGEKEERQKFIDYASKIVPSIYRVEHPLNQEDKIPANMDKWYEYKTWENEKGTFITFFTPSSTIAKSEGYQLHKLFPNLKFIYRSIDEGLPNHCGKWEFSPDDSPSENAEKDLEILNWMNLYVPLIQVVSNKETASENFKKELAKKCNNDPAEIQRIIDLFQNQPDEDLCIDMSDSMCPCFANDNYFKLSEEELVNSPEIPQCTLTWESFKSHSYRNDFDDDYDDYN